jgi:hypothetical protein
MFDCVRLKHSIQRSISTSSGERVKVRRDLAPSSANVSLLATASIKGITCRLSTRTEILVKLFQFYFRQIFDRGKSVLGAFHRNDELGQLGLQRQGVAVLGILDEKNHQEGDDRRRGVDHELPSVAVAKGWTCDGPKNDEACREQKRSGRTRHPSCRMREPCKEMVETMTSIICGLRVFLV